MNFSSDEGGVLDGSLCCSISDKYKRALRILGSDTIESEIWRDIQKENALEEQKREVYDRGDGATILLFNKIKKTVILIKQFRLPTYLNKNESGFLIEACAGVLEEEHPEECIKRETEEETGYHLHDVKKIFHSFLCALQFVLPQAVFVLFGGGFLE